MDTYDIFKKLSRGAKFPKKTNTVQVSQFNNPTPSFPSRYCVSSYVAQ